MPIYIFGESFVLHRYLSTFSSLISFSSSSSSFPHTNQRNRSVLPLLISSDGSLSSKPNVFLHLGKIPLIGCGGVRSGEDAYKKTRAGATIFQLYIGFAKSW
ncbi:dihydroorotate dehydrogenase (quinone), mitochondrial-like isoform X2 [Brassica napus]|uniref:dihydroorotate dehydrogenase (quinone), mitochondrial-like isoform X2 n=1 Tax=Brassica napus TaxID=3708 RepID=UPI00207A9AE9|nr:dihydroorotate dehydrogenase (quinone), mitochondrial-like isoform X2 [Brassica napus]